MWTPLHEAARSGDIEAVRRLLADGADPNAREAGDNTYPMHWAAADGHLEIVKALADAGGDVIGEGDDHQLEVIGWATCWDTAHADVADFLVSRGARHHVFSAIALNLADEVARHSLDTRMSRNEASPAPAALRDPHAASGDGEAADRAGRRPARDRR